MSTGHPVQRMNDLCEITSSKRIHAADYVAQGVPFYRGREITEKHKGRLDVSTELFIERTKFEEIRSRFGAPEQGDLLLTSVGTLGSPYVVRSGEEFYFKDGNLTWFRRFRGLDSRFLYYWLLSPIGRAELTKATIGSSQSAYTIVLLKQMEISVPPLPVQRRIAAILSAYDDLIENCERRIRVLDEMARALYREWFVLFRYPGHEKTPLVDSALGRIPDGWRIARIVDEFRTVLGGTPSRAVGEYWVNGTVPWINSGKVNDLRITVPTTYITELAVRKSAAKLMPRRTTVIAITGATLGQVSYLEIAASANQSVVGIVDPTETRAEWLCLTIRERIAQIISAATGGAQQHINKEVVNETPLVLPPPTTCAAFVEQVRPVFDAIAGLIWRAGTLRTTRDLLLPRLISGELAVEDTA